MRRFWALPLRRQIVIGISFLLVPVVAGAVWSGWVTLKERRDELGEQSRVIALTTAAYINRDLLGYDDLAAQVTAAPPVRALDPAGAAEILGRAVQGRPAVLKASLVAPDGRVIAATDPPPERLEDSPWQVAVVARRARVLAPMQSAPSGLRYVVLGYPVIGSAGQVVAALGFHLSLRNLSQVVDALALPPRSVVSLVDADGVVLARSRDAEQFVARSIVPVRGAGGDPLVPHRATGLDGVVRMYAETLVPSGPWLIRVGIPVSVAFDRAAVLWRRNLIILLVGLAGWFAIALGLSRHLVAAVSHLDSVAQRIASGDFTPMTPRRMRSREFAGLQDAFAQMLRRFNDTRQALDAQMAEERRIRRELESLQGQVIRQERLAAVGQLVSGVAHEINNPLQAILGFSELLQMRADVPESVQSDLRLIQKESARASGIVRNLVLFARQQPGTPAPIRLMDVIASVAELRQHKLESENIQLQVEEHSTGHVKAVTAELQQVLLNFVINAEQAILHSGRLPGRIMIRTHDEGDRVVLEVEDTGPGVAPEDEARLFEPFFTTKPVGQGTGLGLSVSYGIIESLGGTIGYRRADSGGGLFYFSLPRVPAESGTV